jgi:hypothetical protein
MLNPIHSTEQMVSNSPLYRFTSDSIVDHTLHWRQKTLLSLDETRKSSLLKEPRTDTVRSAGEVVRHE